MVDQFGIPPSVGCAPGGTLGTGKDIRIFLMPKGGGRMIAELKPDSGFFTRALDRTSLLEMSLTTGGALGDYNSAGLAELVPWATEILVIRDGRDAWCGPVVDVKFNFETVEVQAEDLSSWWDRRIIPKDMRFEKVDASKIFMALHEAAMSIDPIPNFIVNASMSGELATREYLYAQSTYTHDAIDELSKTSVDWTAYGRTIIVSGQEIEADPRLMLYDDMWVTPPRVRMRGNDQATYVMINAKENILGIAVASPEVIDYYGRIDRIFDEAAIEDQESADVAARTRLEMLQNPVYIESPAGAGLKADAPITLPELIPGIRVRVDSRATAKKVVADFRLSGIKVNFNGQVLVDLQPLGSIADEQGDPGITNEVV